MSNYNGFPATSAYPTVLQEQYYQPTVTQPRYNQNVWQNQYSTAVPSFNSQYNIQQPSNNLIWVQGIEGAKSYMIPNNSTVALWDSEEQTVYIKSVDQNGKPSMTILDYVDRNNNTTVAVETKKSAGVKQSDYITKEQFDDLNSQIVTKEQFDTLNEQVVTKEQLKTLNSQIYELQQKLNEFQKLNTRKENRNNGKSSI